MKPITITAGFIFLVLLGGVLSRSLYGEFIENELVGRTKRVLTASGYDDVEVKFNHHYVTIESSPEVYRDRDLAWIAQTIDSDVQGAYVKVPGVSSEIEIRWFEDGSTRISGQVPGNDLRKRLIDLVKESRPDSDLEAEGFVYGAYAMPTRWLEHSQTIVEEISRIGNLTSFVADEDGFRVEGKIQTAIHRVTTERELSRLLGRIAPTDIQLTLVEQFEPGIDIQPIDKGYQIKGSLGSESAKAALIQCLRESIPEGQTLEESIGVSPDYRSAWWRRDLEDTLSEYLRETNFQGGVKFTGKSVDFTGSMSNRQKVELLIARMTRDRPEGISTSNQLVLVPSIEPELHLRLDTDRKMKLTGMLPDQGVGNAIFEKLEIPCMMEIETSEMVKPVPWGDVSALVNYFGKSLLHGELTIGVNGIVLKGVSDSEESYQSLLNIAANSIGSGYRVEDAIELQIPKPEEEVWNIEADLKDTVVYFVHGSNQINPHGIPNVEKMVELIDRMPEEIRLVVGGYTDTKGKDWRNEEIGLERANALMEKLVELGVDPGRLTPRHFSEQASAEVWRSRRAELSLASKPE